MADWSDIFLGLPPQLQGAAVVVAAGGFGIFGYLRFFSHLRGEAPTGQSTDFAIGGPTTFADMNPVRELTKAVVMLARQTSRNAAANEKAAAAYEKQNGTLAQLSDLIGQFVVDQREQREEQELEDAWQRGHDEGARQRTPRRRPQPKKPAGRTG